jgi:hypothetical protein
MSKKTELKPISIVLGVITTKASRYNGERPVCWTARFGAVAACGESANTAAVNLAELLCPNGWCLTRLKPSRSGSDRYALGGVIMPIDRQLLEAEPSVAAKLGGVTR